MHLITIYHKVVGMAFTGHKTNTMKSLFLLLLFITPFVPG